MEQKWIQVDIETTSAGIEPVGAMLLDLALGGYSVLDAADFEAFLAGKHGHWDYIDENLMKLRDSSTILTAYIAENEQGGEKLVALKSGLSRLKQLDASGEWGKLSYELYGVNEEDWANAWKKYYKPVKTGERLVVCPSWEEYQPQSGEVVLQLDPGMAFGTGTHETTRLCLKAMDIYPPDNQNVLDIGCGSGILSIAAMLLGAKSALGIDIDENSVRVAAENAAANSVAATYRCGDLAGGVTGRYGIVFANIVADAIIALVKDVPQFLETYGVFITSGIIDTREAEVVLAIEQAGLRTHNRWEMGGWVCLAAKLV